MNEPTVLLTISGDTNSTEVHADTTVPLADLIAGWAAACSSHQLEDLVAVSGDSTALYDPTVTLADLELGYGAVIRLVTGEEAVQVLDVRTVEAVPDPITVLTTAPGAVPVIGLTTSARPDAPGTDDHEPTPARPEQLWAVQPPWTAPPAPPFPLPPPPPPPLLAPDGARRTSSPLEQQPHPPDIQLDHVDPTPTPTISSRPAGCVLPPKVGGGRRFWMALRAAVDPKAAPTVPAGAFAKATQTTARDRYRRALRATNWTRQLDGMIRAAPLPRCMVIAVVSPKGGTGKTTITALLGTLLAELCRDPVIALDADPDLGDLQDKLGGETTPAALVDDLTLWLDQHPNATPAALAGRLGVGPHGLRFIPTPRPPEASRQRMIAAADFVLYQRLIARLRYYAGIVVVDCGTGLLDPPVRAALEAADQIVVVTDSSVTAARQVAVAADLLPPGTPTWLVANKTPPKGSTLDLDQVATATPRLNGVTVIPMPTGGRLAETVVTPNFAWPTAPQSWREPVRELAARLANNWGTLD